MGGAWERIIQSAKKHLAVILHVKLPKKHVLRTLFTEVENINNNRLLTFNSTNPDDSEPITNNRLLIGAASVSLPVAKTYDRNLMLLIYK